MIDKLNTYSLSGVAEYWIVDPKNESVLVYQFSDYSIDQVKSYSIDKTIKSYRFTDLEVAVEDVFEIK